MFSRSRCYELAVRRDIPNSTAGSDDAVWRVYPGNTKTPFRAPAHCALAANAGRCGNGRPIGKTAAAPADDN